MLTEEDAQQKMCHRTLFGGQEEYTQGTPCLGSECMAWRWFDYIDQADKKLRLIQENRIGFQRAEIVEDRSLRRGYCGLAGASQ